MRDIVGREIGKGIEEGIEELAIFDKEIWQSEVGDALFVRNYMPSLIAQAAKLEETPPPPAEIGE